MQYLKACCELCELRRKDSLCLVIVFDVQHKVFFSTLSLLQDSCLAQADLPYTAVTYFRVTVADTVNVRVQFQNLPEKIGYIHCLPLINEVGKTDNI